MALDFPTADDFPGGAIPDGEEYEGFYWDATDEVWRRKCDEVDLDDIYLRRRGDTVDDATARADYDWNEGVRIATNYGATRLNLEGADATLQATANANVSGPAGATVYSGVDLNLTASRDNKVTANNQDVILEASSGAERVNRTLADTDIDEQITNKRYVDEQDQILANQIVELEEEIEAIAPSVERGFWTMNLLGTVANQGQMSLYDDDYTNVGSPTGLFKNAKSIWLNEKDNSGTPHGFAGVEAGELIELFVQGADEFGLYEVVDVHDETNGATQWWVIEVNFVRTLEDTSTADNGDIIRVKIFNAPEGGSADEFVRKEGDDMSGRLRFETENDAYEQDYRKPSDGNTAFIQLKNVSDGITRLGTIWQPQTKDEVAIGKNLHVELSVYCTSYYGYYLKDADDGSGRKERVLIDPRIQFYEFNNDKRGRLKWGGSDDRVTWTEAGGKLSSGASKARLTWDENRVTIPKVPVNSATVTGFTIKGATSTGYGSSVANQDAALLKVEHVGTYSDRVQYFGRIASDRDITTKQYVDETIATQLRACGLQLGRFTYKRSTDSFVSGSMKSNTSTNPANITQINIWKSNADGIVFGEDFYSLAIVPKMYFHFMDKSSASYVGRIDSVTKISNGVRLDLTPITGDISGTTYVNNSYDVAISYNKYGVNKFPQ